MKEDELSEVERRLFDSLEKETQPPAELEARIISKLKNDGLIQNTTTMNVYLKWAASIAAAVLVFFGGMYFERSGQNDPAGEEMAIQIEPTKGYALLLHEDQNFKPGDPMEMFEEYGAWMENTFARGVKITGQELKNDATIVTSAEISATGESPERRTTGYFLLEANSMEEAIAVAKDNPHVKYGGIVEVKSFMVR